MSRINYYSLEFVSVISCLGGYNILFKNNIHKKI